MLYVVGIIDIYPFLFFLSDFFTLLTLSSKQPVPVFKMYFQKGCISRLTRKKISISVLQWWNKKINNPSNTVLPFVNFISSLFLFVKFAGQKRILSKVVLVDRGSIGPDPRHQNFPPLFDTRINFYYECTVVSTLLIV